MATRRRKKHAVFSLPLRRAEENTHRHTHTHTQMFVVLFGVFFPTRQSQWLQTQHEQRALHSDPDQASVCERSLSISWAAPSLIPTALNNTNKKAGSPLSHGGVWALCRASCWCSGKQSGAWGPPRGPRGALQGPQQNEGQFNFGTISLPWWQHNGRVYYCNLFSLEGWLSPLLSDTQCRRSCSCTAN